MFHQFEDDHTNDGGEQEIHVRSRSDSSSSYEEDYLSPRSRSEHEKETPPFSRIFIVCDKNLDDDDLHRLFGVFGQIEFTRMIRETKSSRSKSLAYVKYYKTSAAARAVEEMNGKQVFEYCAPLRVQIAEPKGSSRNRQKKYSKEPEDTPARSRLFVVCPKNLTEEALTNKFSEFEDLEYCKVIMDRASNTSKGFAYVKFAKASKAAEAMEAINETGEIDNMRVKVLIADPKAKRATNETVTHEASPAVPIVDPNLLHYNMMMMMGYGGSPPGFEFHPPMFMDPAMYGQQYMQSRLFVVCHKSVNEEDLATLFSGFPGMDYCDLKRNKQTGESKGFAFINFLNPQGAYMALCNTHGIEFPPQSGHTLKVMYAQPQTPHGDSIPFIPGTEYFMPSMEYYDMYPPVGMYQQYGLPYGVMSSDVPMIPEMYLQYPRTNAAANDHQSSYTQSYGNHASNSNAEQHGSNSTSGSMNGSINRLNVPARALTPDQCGQIERLRLSSDLRISADGSDSPPGIIHAGGY